MDSCQEQVRLKARCVLKLRVAEEFREFVYHLKCMKELQVIGDVCHHSHVP